MTPEQKITFGEMRDAWMAMVERTGILQREPPADGGQSGKA
jgi:hypothetical protein